jgi:hypothetical protein
MRTWTREIAGWALIILGLIVFYRCYVLLAGEFHYIWEAAILMVVGVFLFRGGIHLLKIAVAAQICLQGEAQPQAQAQAQKPSPWAGRGPVRPPSMRRVATKP